MLSEDGCWSRKVVVEVEEVARRVGFYASRRPAAKRERAVLTHVSFYATPLAYEMLAARPTRVEGSRWLPEGSMLACGGDGKVARGPSSDDEVQLAVSMVFMVCHDGNEGFGWA